MPRGSRIDGEHDLLDMGPNELEQGVHAGRLLTAVVMSRPMLVAARGFLIDRVDEATAPGTIEGEALAEPRRTRGRAIAALGAERPRCSAAPRPAREPEARRTVARAMVVAPGRLRCRW